MFASAPRQVIGSQHKPLDPLAARERFNDFGQIRGRHPTVKEMVGLDQDTNAARALVEAARGAGTRPELRQTARGELFLQCRTHFF